MGPRVRYEIAPTLNLRYPECSACGVEVDLPDEAFECPVCGTVWPTDAGEDRPGTLYSDWSGDAADAPLVSHDEGEAYGNAYERERRAALLARYGFGAHS